MVSCMYSDIVIVLYLICVLLALEIALHVSLCPRRLSIARLLWLVAQSCATLYCLVSIFVKFVALKLIISTGRFQENTVAEV